ADTGVIVSDPSRAAGLAAELDTLAPAKVLGTAPSNAADFFVSYSGVHSGADSIVTVVSQSLGASPSFTAKQIDVGNIDSFTANATTDMTAPQPGSGAPIQANDDRITDVVYRNGFLYAVANVLPTSGPDLGLPTIHWWKFNVADSSNITLADQ